MSDEMSDVEIENHPLDAGKNFETHELIRNANIQLLCGNNSDFCL